MPDALNYLVVNAVTTTKYCQYELMLFQVHIYSFPSYSCVFSHKSASLLAAGVAFVAYPSIGQVTKAINKCCYIFQVYCKIQTMSCRDVNPDYTFCKAPTSMSNLAKACLDAALSNGSFSFLPKILGKYSGSKRPSTRLASVTAKGPPTTMKTTW